MKLLFLQNGPRPRSVSGLEDRFAAAGFDVDVHWAYQSEFPDRLDGYGACFVSGSPHGAYEDIPWIHREHDVLRELAGRRVPMLGICFGSQILGSALCGRDQVFRRPTCEVGFVALDVTEAARVDPIARDLGRKVDMFVWHNDEVRAGHADMMILASSPDCPNHIWRHRRYAAWGIQGHPEVYAAQARDWFELSRQRLEADGADVEALKRDAIDAVEAKSMLTNFMTQARGGHLAAA
ncbi:MAG: type 1 glutamine amidotransferase [Alphaproteobacteria bacterium]|nr:type 1 glutamine amidotransferase [Alphaproteobacteria bacterium]